MAEQAAEKIVAKDCDHLKLIIAEAIEKYGNECDSI